MSFIWLNKKTVTVPPPPKLFTRQFGSAILLAVSALMLIEACVRRAGNSLFRKTEVIQWPSPLRYRCFHQKEDSPARNPSDQILFFLTVLQSSDPSLSISSTTKRTLASVGVGLQWTTRRKKFGSFRCSMGWYPSISVPCSIIFCFSFGATCERAQKCCLQ